jgi:hypothetical protein
MSLSMYQAAVPPFVRALATLKYLLAKGEAHCAARGVDPATLLGARLALDMLPLTRQVQMVSDSAKGAGARLAAVAVPSFPDDEAAFAGAAEREVKLKTGASEHVFTGLDYLQGFALPNAFFHLVTAYNILRHNGVEIGKMDYLTGGRA